MLGSYRSMAESSGSETTTIEIRRETWQELNQLKTGPGDTFDDVVTRLLKVFDEDS